MEADDSAKIIELLTDLSRRLSALEGDIGAKEALSHKRAVKAKQQARYRARRAGVANEEHNEEPEANPSIDEVLEWTRQSNPPCYTEAIVREWFRECELMGWRDMKGERIRNWKGYLLIWYNNYNFRKRKADPDRLPDARVAAQKRNIVHADNWRGTKPENLQHVF